MNVLHLCIMVFSWLFGSVLLVRRSLANRFLGGFLMVLGFQMGLYLVSDTAGLSDGRWMGFLGVVFLYGPLIFGYVMAMLQPDFSIKSRHVLHLIPAFGCIIAGWIGVDVRNQLGWGLYLSLGYYLMQSFRVLGNAPGTHGGITPPYFQKKQRWISFFLRVFSVVLLVDFLSYVTDRMRATVISWSIIDEWVLGLALMFVIVLVWKGLVQPQLFGEHQSDVNPSPSRPRRRQTADKDQHRLIRERLEKLFETEQPYRNPGLTLRLLAEMLTVPPRQLSEVVNQTYRQNVSEYINAHRIAWVKKRLVEPADPGETILEVLYEAGFNSKSSFNTLFKRSTGMTPSQFKKQGGSQQNS